MDKQLEEPIVPTAPAPDPPPPTAPAPRYADGSRVLSADGVVLGEVVATFQRHLIVERGAFFPTILFVPYTAIDRATTADIVLTLSAADAYAQGWHQIPQDPPMPEPDARPSASRVRPGFARRAATPATPSTPATPLTVPEVDGPPMPAPTVAPISTEPVAARVPSEAATTERPLAEERELAHSAPNTHEPVAPSAHVAPGAPVALASTTPSPTSPTIPTPTSAPAASPTPIAPIDVQAMEPDASVPPPIDPENPAPSVIGIPGRRLTDAELWSLLEPRAAGSSPDETPEAETAEAPSAGEEAAKPDS